MVWPTHSFMGSLRRAPACWQQSAAGCKQVLYLGAGDLFRKGLDPLQAGCHISADAMCRHGVDWGFLLRMLCLLSGCTCACSALKLCHASAGVHAVKLSYASATVWSW